MSGAAGGAAASAGGPAAGEGPLAFLFAGQGSQAVGMGGALARRSPGFRALLAEADAALDLPLARLMAEGPAEELQRTEVAQPALLTLAVGHARHLLAAGLAPSALAGHSLGQYAALVAASALDFADALRLVRARGRLMQETVPEGEGAMTALVGLDRDEVRALCAAAVAEGAGAVGIACHNAPGQTVISGARAAVALVAERAVEGFATAVPLAVSAPFHSALLEPMLRRFETLVLGVSVRAPAIPVIDNVTAAPLEGPDAIRRSLVLQVTAPVLFEESLGWLRARGIARYIQCGPGAALLGFAKRVAKGARLDTFEAAAGFGAEGGAEAGDG